MQGEVENLLSNEEVREHYLGVGKEEITNYREVKMYKRRQRVVW